MLASICVFAVPWLRADIVAQWDVAGNAGLKLEDLTLGSASVVQWVCCEHQQPVTWAVKVASRTRRPAPISGRVSLQCYLK